MKKTPGLGELLRHLTDLVDEGALHVYQARGLALFKPRYTPVMRALALGADTVTAITQMSHLTQGAISQTVALMSADGLLEKFALEDGRKSGLRLTAGGQALLRQLEPHWETTFEAIGFLEAEIGHPLLDVLSSAVAALQRESFADRLLHAQQGVRQ